MYENMLMPLDDIKFGSDFKLASVTLLCSTLVDFLGEDMAGLKACRSVSDAIVMCDNPDDHEPSGHAKIYIKGSTSAVDTTLVYLMNQPIAIVGTNEVNPYAPAELVMPVPREHVSKVLSLITDVAQVPLPPLNPSVMLMCVCVCVWTHGVVCRTHTRRYKPMLSRLE